MPARPLHVFSTLQRVSGRRLASTATSAAAAAAAPPPPPPPTFLQRYRRAIIWSTLSLAGGAILGTGLRQLITPPAYPVPHSHEDAILLQDLSASIDNEFKVKVLRGKCTAAAANLRGDDASWRELPTASARNSYVGEVLAGARGLGVERAFWNDRDKELVAVVWFGGAVTGWPGVTHGGCIATLLGEKLALAARLAKHGGSGAGDVSEAVVDANSSLNQLVVNYKKPTHANAFYVVRVFPRIGLPSGVDDDVEVEAQLETLQGQLCVTATAVVPVSDVPGPTTRSLGKLKSWVGWPSRSQA